MILHNRSYWSYLKTSSVTVSVQPGRNTPRDVYEVKSVMDIGTGEQTVMLDHQGYVLDGQVRSSDFHLPLPVRMDGMRFLYAGHKQAVARDLDALIRDKDAKLEQIVPDVIQPGDYLVFRECPRREGVILIDALRLAAHKQLKSMKALTKHNAV